MVCYNRAFLKLLCISEIIYQMKYREWRTNICPSLLPFAVVNHWPNQLGGRVGLFGLHFIWHPSPESTAYCPPNTMSLTTSIAKRLLSSQTSGEIACPMSIMSSASSSRTLMIISLLPRHRNRRKEREKKVTPFSDKQLDTLARHALKVLFPHLWCF